MPKTNQNLDLYEGDTRLVLITLDDSVPLPAVSSRWWIGKTPAAAGADVLLKKVPVMVDNVMQITIETADFASLPAGTYYHEAEITVDGGRSYTVSIGQVVVYPTMKP